MHNKSKAVKSNKIWVASYHHRFGEDYALFQHEPTEKELQDYWVNEYEPDREDEWFGVSGPLVVLK